MDFHELVLSHLNQADQDKLRIQLTVEAVSAYCASKQGVESRISTFGQDGASYHILDSFRATFAQINIHYLPPSLLLQLPDEEWTRLKQQFPQYRHNSYAEIPLDGSISAHELLYLIDRAYAHVVAYLSEHDRNFLKLMDRQPVDEAKIRQVIEFEGLKHETDTILGLLQPALRIHARRKSSLDMESYESRLGGMPFFPEGVDWPHIGERPLSFLAQINLSELPDFAGRADLPERGMLYFFTMYGWGEDYFPWDEEERLSKPYVYFYEGQLDKIKYTSPPRSLPYYAEYRDAKITFMPEWSLPNAHSNSVDPVVKRLNWSEDEQERLHRVQEDLQRLNDDYFGYWNHHQLLGYRISLYGNSIEFDAKERLLLRIDSDYYECGFEWGDGGTLDFMIDKGDLKARNFDNVSMIFDVGG